MRTRDYIAAVLNYPFILWFDSYETFVFTHGEYGEFTGWLLYVFLPALLMVGLVTAWFWWEVG